MCASSGLQPAFSSWILPYTYFQWKIQYLTLDISGSRIKSQVLDLKALPIFSPLKISIKCLINTVSVVFLGDAEDV